MCDVTEIADGAFESVQNLEGIGLQGAFALERIGARAFANCTNLTQVYGSYSVTEIGDKAFFGCSKLECVMMKLQKNIGKLFKVYD